MDMVLRNGKMAQSMLGNGNSIRHVVKVNSGMLMVIFSKVSGLMIKPMASAFIPIKMEPNMKVIGRKTCSMGMARNRGQMAQNMKENITMVKNMVRAIIFGMMAQNMMDNGLIIKLKVMVFINGKMAVYSQDSG